MIKTGKKPARGKEPAAGRILIVDDHARARESMRDILLAAGHDVLCCASALEGLARLDDESFDVILTDLKMPGMNGLEFIHELQRRRIDAQIVMVTAYATVASAVDAMRHGAFDYIEKPFDAGQLEELIARALSAAGGDGRRSSIPVLGEPPLMLGDSPAMKALRQRIAQAGPTDVTILITGESGTGKELVARSIHAASQRAGGPLVSLNCPALSPQLMESELFGHERGAFTSADAPRVGRFELAEKGTILLDEVTEIELPLQAKLLRVLQEKTYERVGASDARKADVRVLATTNRDIREAVAAGGFREDLYFRLAVVPVHVPPLRQRSSDVPLLAEHFLAQAALRLERPTRSLDRSALDLLAHYHWPGNVREMENLMTRASVLGRAETITADELQCWLIGREEADFAPGGHSTASLAAGTKLADMERTLIEATLAEFGGHRGKTAKALDIGVRTLANKLRSYGYGPRAKVGAAA